MIFTSSIKKLLVVASLFAFSNSASAAYALADYLGISSITTLTGTATATPIFVDPFDAYGYTDSGVVDILSDGVTYSSSTSPNGFGTALNSGFTSSSEAYATNDVYSDAYTTAEVELEISGQGIVIVLFEFALTAEAMEPDSYAEAYIDVFGNSAGAYSYVYADYYGFNTDSTTGFLSLTFEADGSGPYSEYLYISTGAYAYSSVPVPAAVWLLGSAILGLVTVGQRKQ